MQTLYTNPDEAICADIDAKLDAAHQVVARLKERPGNSPELQSYLDAYHALDSLGNDDSPLEYLEPLWRLKDDIALCVASAWQV